MTGSDGKKRTPKNLLAILAPLAILASFRESLMVLDIGGSASAFAVSERELDDFV